MEIIKFTQAPEGTKYLAELEVYHEGTIYRRIRIMRSAQGHLFVNLPVYGEEDGFGSKRWVQFFEFPKDRETEFKRLLLEIAQPKINPIISTGEYQRMHNHKPTQAHQKPQEQYKAPPQQQYMPDLGDCPF